MEDKEMDLEYAKYFTEIGFPDYEVAIAMNAYENSKPVSQCIADVLEFRANNRNNSQ